MVVTSVLEMATKATSLTEKETQPTEKECKSIEGEIISLEIRENIRRALLIDLGGDHKVISHTDSEKAETDKNNRMGRMVLATDDSKRIIPDPYYNNEHLIYSKRPRFAYTVWTSTSSDDRRFLFGWKDDGRVYVIAPYSVAPVEEDSNVLCSYRLDVTEAVYGKDPVRSLNESLKRLANRSNDERGYDRDMYHWGVDGVDDTFSVHKKTIVAGSWFWKVGGEGKMEMTSYRAKTALIRFLEL